MALANEAGYVFRNRYPEREDVYRRFDEASAEARGRLDCRLDQRYGEHPRERFDLFPGEPGAPLVVFVHGGYWQSLDKARFSFVADALVRRGFSVALPGYPLAPEASVGRIVESVRASIAAILAALPEPPAFWIASGHSAGGHLAAMLALSPAACMAPAACVPISGIFDLEPLLETSLNAALKLDTATAQDLSPIRRTPVDCPLVAFVGGAETPDFVRQSEDFASHWGTARQSRLVVLRNLNHYTILGDLLEEQSEIAEWITRMAAGHRREGREGERH